MILRDYVLKTGPFLSGDKSYERLDHGGSHFVVDTSCINVPEEITSNTPAYCLSKYNEETRTATFRRIAQGPVSEEIIRQARDNMALRLADTMENIRGAEDSNGEPDTFD